MDNNAQRVGQIKVNPKGRTFLTVECYGLVFTLFKRHFH